jgi:hypothetical protein
VTFRNNPLHPRQSKKGFDPSGGLKYDETYVIEKYLKILAANNELRLLAKLR